MIARVTRPDYEAFEAPLRPSGYCSRPVRLQEYGRLIKTNFVLAWLGDEELRRRIGRQLNKGEQLHALRRAGAKRSRRSHIDELLAGGEYITASEIEHISPLAHQHIHLYGHYPFDLATRPDGHRPLRVRATPPAPTPKTLNRV